MDAPGTSLLRKFVASGYDPASFTPRFLKNARNITSWKRTARTAHALPLPIRPPMPFDHRRRDDKSPEDFNTWFPVLSFLAGLLCTVG